MIHPYLNVKLRYNVIVLCGLLGIFIIGQSSYARKAEYRFKIATLAPDRSIWINAYNDIADEITKFTDGEVEFKCYPGGIQGDEITVIRKMRINQLQGAGFTGTGLAQICKESLVLQIPHTFTSHEEFDFAFKNIKDELEAICRNNGYEVLGWPHLGFVYMFSTDPITEVSTLRSAKPWLIEDDLISKVMFETVGISAVSAQIGDVLTGLRSGLIRTVYAPPVGMLSLQWFTKVEYRLDIKGSYAFGTFILTKKKWDKLPDHYKKAIRTICKRNFDRLNNKVREQNNEALEVLAKKQIKTISPTAIGLKEFADTSENVAKKLVGNTFSEELLANLRTSLADYRKDHPPE